VKVLRSYYEDSGEDAFLMQYRILNDTGPDEVDDVLDHVSIRGGDVARALVKPRRGGLAEPERGSSRASAPPSLRVAANSFSRIN